MKPEMKKLIIANLPYLLFVYLFGNGGIFSMLQNLSETVIVPIAAAILALVMCYELIDMIVEKNNMHDDVC